MNTGNWNNKNTVVTHCGVNPLFRYFAMREIKNDIHLNQDVQIEDDVINLQPGHGFQVEECIVLWENNKMIQAEVIQINVDADPNKIKIEMPVTFVFTTQNTKVIRGDTRMNVNGSIIPIDYTLKFYNIDIPIIVSYVIIVMQHGIYVPDDGKFGGLPALAKGLYFEKAGDKGKISLGNYRNNIDFRLLGCDVCYSQKAPAGGNATTCILNIEHIFKQALYICPQNNDYLTTRIRDDLSALDYFKIAVMGSYAEGEQ